MQWYRRRCVGATLTPAQWLKGRWPRAAAALVPLVLVGVIAENWLVFPEYRRFLTTELYVPQFYEDTRGEEFEPVIVDESNKLVFRKAPVEADGGQYPNPNSAAANLPTTGAILIFKLPNPVLNYRPLELEIESSDLPGKKATVTLDV